MTIAIRDDFAPKDTMRGFDSMGRRSRFVPHSTEERVDLTRDDFDFVRALRFGPLDTRYLLAFPSIGRRNQQRKQQRLTQLFHEDNTYIDGEPWGYRLLTRPIAQRKLIDHKSGFVIYNLTPATKKLCAKMGIPIIQNSGPLPHQYATASAVASIALTAGDAFKDQTETIGNIPLHFMVNGEELRPDALFSITTDRRRIYFVELDRGTENLRESEEARKSIEAMLRRYIHFIGKGQYKKDLNTTDGALLYFITTSRARMESAMQILNELLDGRGANHIIFNYVPHFGAIFTQPPILSYLYEHPVERIGREPFFLNQ